MMYSENGTQQILGLQLNHLCIRCSLCKLIIQALLLLYDGFSVCWAQLVQERYIDQILDMWY